MTEISAFLGRSFSGKKEVIGNRLRRDRDNDRRSAPMAGQGAKNRCLVSAGRRFSESLVIFAGSGIGGGLRIVMAECWVDLPVRCEQGKCKGDF